jgi:hypothetical protein
MATSSSAAEVRWRRLPRGRAHAERLRARARTTPGRLRTTMVVLVAAAIVAGLVAGRAADTRRSAAEAVATQDEPLMVQADGLYASLSDADATAAATFLTGGLESPVRRQRYLADIRRASLQLSALTRRVQGSPEAAAAVAEVAAQLPVYTGLMETARANNREGFPVGAAYLRQASDVMRQRILPAAGRLYAVEARRLGDHQAQGTARGGLVAALAVCVAALVLLVLAQVVLARRTHRILNVPLVVATVVLVALSAWLALAMTAAQSALASAQRNGSDSVQVLSAARILALRAQADESLALAARGGGDRYVADFAVVARALERPGGLFADGARLARRSGSTGQVDAVSAGWRRYRAAHRQVATLQADGRFGAAILRAVGPRAKEPALVDRVNRGFNTAIAAAQARFERAAGDATSALRGLGLGIPLLIVATAALAIIGLQRRIDEYR